MNLGRLRPAGVAGVRAERGGVIRPPGMSAPSAAMFVIVLS